jgi:hypothetical protein
MLIDYLPNEYFFIVQDRIFCGVELIHKLSITLPGPVKKQDRKVFQTDSTVTVDISWWV